jgi:hypothetical protein
VYHSPTIFGIWALVIGAIGVLGAIFISDKYFQRFSTITMIVFGVTLALALASVIWAAL